MSIAPDSRVGLLISYLCSVPFHTASRQEICDVLWPDKNRERQQLSLRQTVFQAQKYVDLVATRHSLALSNIEHDLAINDWSTAEVVLKNWRHPWCERWQDQDTHSIVTTGAKILSSVDEPFQKVEILTRIRELAPLDQRFVDLLKEQYRLLGWESQITALDEEVSHAISKMSPREEHENYSQQIAETLGSELLLEASVSHLQRLELALSLFPLFFSQGKLNEGIHLISSLSKKVPLTKELDLRVRYSLIRLAINRGDRSLAYSYAHGLDTHSKIGVECFILGMAAFAKNRFDQCLRWVKRGLKDATNTPDLSGVLCSLGATACNFVQLDNEALEFCDRGIEFAIEGGNRFQEVAIRSSKVISMRALDISFDIEPEVLELVEISRSEGFSIRQAHLLGILGQHYQLKGDLKKAQEALEHAIEVSEKVKNDETKAMALDYLGEALVKAKKYPEAVLIFQQSTLIRRRQSDKLGAATSYRGAGRGLLMLEEFDFSLKMFERAIGLYRSLEHEILEGGCLLYKVVSLVKLDRMTAANESVEQVRKLFRGKGITTIRNAVDRDIHRMVECIFEDQKIDCLDLCKLYTGLSNP